MSAAIITIVLGIAFLVYTHLENGRKDREYQEKQAESGSDEIQALARSNAYLRAELDRVKEELRESSVNSKRLEQDLRRYRDLEARSALPKSEAYDDGYDNGYESGYHDGLSESAEDGFERGYLHGYNKGYSEAEAGRPWKDYYGVMGLLEDDLEAAKVKNHEL